MSKPPPTRSYCKRNRPLPYCYQNRRTPRHWKFTQHHRTTRPPPPWVEKTNKLAINVYGATVSSKLKNINVFSYHISEQPNERQRINLLLLSEDAAENQTKLVGCFGFNGPLRQYFSLYRAVSQREGER